jgi:uncharacterized protein
VKLHAVSHAKTVKFAGSEWSLLPERMVFSVEHAALLLADLHLGKAAHFRRSGLAVPDGDSVNDLARIERCVRQTQAAKIIVLGDFTHQGLLSSEELKRWQLLRKSVACSVHVVLGNHDRHFALSLAEQLQISVHINMKLGGVMLRHEPEFGAEFEMAGHLHPVIKPTGMARQPVFWRHHRSMIFPAFSHFTGGMLVEAHRDDDLYVVPATNAIRLHT